MIWTMVCRRCSRMAVPLALVLTLGGATGCGLLDVTDDPTAILEEELNNADGAQLLRLGAIRYLKDIVTNAVWETGLVADEFFYQRPGWAQPWQQPDEFLDSRNGQMYNEKFNDGIYGGWQVLWGRLTTVALEKLRAYAPPGARAQIGEMHAVRGFAAVNLAENFCSGYPLHEVVNLERVYGPPLSTEQVFDHALAQFDTAVDLAADSARILGFARIGRARTLLGLGRFAEAATAAAGVPTDYVYKVEFNSSMPDQYNFSLSPRVFIWAEERSVANNEGGEGLDFVAANDPRAVTVPKGMARDGVTPLRGIGKYDDFYSGVVIASGIEARLIEAEAALQAGDPNWLTMLNTLRTTCTDAGTCPTPAPAGTGGVAGLPPLADPGTDAARVDLLFRERAFWLFATGHRLADLRRLTRQYDRPAESVFPSGPYWAGNTYGVATSVPYPKTEVQLSPGVVECKNP